MLISPLKTVDEPLNPALTWHASDSADAYHVQVSASSSFLSTIVDSAVSDTTFQLHSLASATRYYWRASALNEHGESRFTPSTYFITEDTATAISKFKNISSDFILYQNYPNPFNPGTTIKYSLSKTANVSLNIYSISGQKIYNLKDQNQSGGIHQVVWNGRDSMSQLVPSGAYFYILKADDFTQIKKTLLLK